MSAFHPKRTFPKLLRRSTENRYHHNRTVLNRGMSDKMSTVQIEPLRLEGQKDAAKVLARAFVTNPLHVAAFGVGAISKNEAFFSIGLSAMQGTKCAAVLDSQIVGVLHWANPLPARFQDRQSYGWLQR